MQALFSPSHHTEQCKSDSPLLTTVYNSMHYSVVVFILHFCPQFYFYLQLSVFSISFMLPRKKKIFVNLSKFVTINRRATVTPSAGHRQHCTNGIYFCWAFNDLFKHFSCLLCIVYRLHNKQLQRFQKQGLDKHSYIQTYGKKKSVMILVH